jgi:hypothetical protein
MNPAKETPIDLPPIARCRRAQIALLAVHLLLAAFAGIGIGLIPPYVSYIPMMWALSAIPLAQAFLLSLWCGLGSSSMAQGLLACLLGTLYLASCQLLTEFVRWIAQPGMMAEGDHWLSMLLSLWAMLASIVTLSAVFLLGIRRWVAEVRNFESDRELPRAGRVQFTILQVLIVTSVAAVVLGLARASRAEAVETIWMQAVSHALFFVVFFVNLLCAAWATLTAGSAWLRIGLVFAVAGLLALALMFGSLYEAEPVYQWLWASMPLMTLVPTTIIVLSLLVVRACGYRLVRPAT